MDLGGAGRAAGDEPRPYESSGGDGRPERRPGARPRAAPRRRKPR